MWKWSNHWIRSASTTRCLDNEWIGMLLHDYDHRHFLRDDGTYDTTTNVIVITELTVKKYGLQLHGQKLMFGHNMALFPFDYLCAKDSLSGKITRTSNTFTIHHFKGSWLTDRDRYVGKLKLKIGRYMPPGLTGHLAAYIAACKFNGFFRANIEAIKWLRR
jgi:hypothetical protein